MKSFIIKSLGLKKQRVALFICFVILSMLPGRMIIADSAAVFETYINTEVLIRIVSKTFDEKIASEVTGEITKHLRHQSQLYHPYGSTFSSVRGIASLPEILKPAFEADSNVQNSARFTKLLTTINKSPVVRGMVRSRMFSGCVTIVLSLKSVNYETATFNDFLAIQQVENGIKNAGSAELLEVISKNYPYQGCKNDYNTKFQQREVFSFP